jgi:hypothetical protein
MTRDCWSVTHPAAILFSNVWRGVFPGTFLERGKRFRSTWASHTSCYWRCALARV